MSSQHRNLAAVWDHLAGRNDISDILREITGHHALQVTLHDDWHRQADDSLQTIIWIKTVFDLQRCYLSGTSMGVSECPPNVSSYLLPPELLFSSILYLIDVKTRLFLSQTTLITSDLIPLRLVLAQTVLSGVRLLLMRRDSLSSRQRKRLQSAIETAWGDELVGGIERFITQEIFSAIFDSLNEGNTVDSHQTERAKARLPTYATGLHPLDIRPEAFVTPLVQAISEEDDDWLDAYWVLYDALWTVECALTQRLMTIRRQSGVVDSEEPIDGNDEILEQLNQQRTGLIVSVFHVTGPMMPSHELLESLAVTLLDWNEDLDTFLLRQDSLLQHRTSLRPSPTCRPSYGKLISELVHYFDAATVSFSRWLSKRKSQDGPVIVNNTRFDMTVDTMQNTIKQWVVRMSAPNAKTISQGTGESILPVYMVNCPKLHVISKWWLAEQLRWCDKWAYEGIQESSSIVNWKDGVKCPSCTSEEKINCARLIEPLQHVPTLTAPKLSQENYGSSQYSVEDSSSYMTSSSSARSHSISDGGTRGTSLPSQTTMTVSIPTSISHSKSDLERSNLAEAQLPQYGESPISPFTQVPLTRRARSYGFGMPDQPISPLNKSLNVPIPAATESRLSFDLPIPVTPSHNRDSAYEKISLSAPADFPDAQPTSSSNSLPQSLPPSLSTAVSWNEESITKSKSTSRGIKLAHSIRRQHSGKEKDTCALPKDPAFAFSTSGHSLLLWGKNGNFVARFDLFLNDTTAIQCCRYEAEGIAVAAAGHRKCALVTSSAASTNRLLVFTGVDTDPTSNIELDSSGRISDICIAISSDDKHLAVSVNGVIELFSLDNVVKRVAFHHQMNVYELRGGVSHRRSIPMTRTGSPDVDSGELKSEAGSWFTEQSKCLSTKEAAEEQQRQTVIMTRKLYFSTDSRRLVVASQLGDHCVYVDVWDITREPVSTISEHSRSFKLPPWTLNDGDLTGVFYDSSRRSALVTAFLGKEYPVLVPFPGYEPLQNETYSTKIISAAQSPSGSTFIVANGMTEIIQFQYTAKGTLAPHRLKKSSGKISTGVFKPGTLALSMPQENCLRVFWIKDGKCMLRSIKLGTTETIRDIDIRSHYDRLMSLKDRPVISQAPSLSIPELDSGDFI